MKLARLWAVCRLDLLHALKRPLFWIWGAIVFLCALGLSNGSLKIQAGDSATGGLQATITSAFAIALELTLLGGLFYTFFVAVVAGMEVIRDGEERVEPLLHSTPLRASEYVWGKFLAALVSSLAMLALQVFLAAFFRHLVTVETKPELIGEFSLLAYLQPALLFGVPLIVFMAGTSFAIGERTRRPVLVNMFPLALLLVSIFVLWLWSPSWLDPRWNRFLMFVDPTGFRWLQQTWLDVDRGAEFYNSSLIGFDAGFYLSRAVMLALGLGAVLSAQRHLARSLRGKRVGARRAAKALAESTESDHTPRRRPLAELGMRRKRLSFLAAMLEISRTELRILLTHPGVWLFLPLLVLNSTFDAIYSVGAFDTRLLLTPGRGAVGSLNELTFTLCLLLMFFTVEGLRREERTRLRAMAYSMPISTRALILGKLLATSALGVLCVAFVALACIVILAVQGTVPLDVTPFALVYGLLLLPTVLFWNALIAALYTLTRNRFATYALGLGLMIWVGIEFALGNMSWTWNWSLVAALSWTDLGPFEMDRTPLLLNRLMVLGAALFLFVLCVRIFPRRAFDSTRVVLRLRPRALGWTALVLLPWAIIPVGLGLSLQKGVNAGADGVRAERWAKDYWRKNVRTWLDAPKPDIVAARVDLELEPAERWLHSRGSLELENPGQEPLAQVALTGAPHWEEVTWTLDAEPFEPDDREGLYVFDLPEPLEPGERCTVGFDFEGVLLGGYSKNGGRAEEFILASGVVLTSFRPTFVPLVGFQEHTGVDEDNRYDSREYPDDFHAGETPALFGPDAPFPVRIRVTAPEAYTMNSVGVLQDEVVRDGRCTRTWESDHPVRFFNVVGGLWDVRHGEGTAVYHHPTHTYNLDEMIAALDGARRYYSEWFHPFPWEELRVSEFAGYAGYAQGFPTNISFSEAIGFLTKDDEHTNTTFFVTAHEAAHQWWGNILMPGRGPGGNLLSEGTSHFSTILLMEQVKGIGARIELCKQLESQYNERRVVDSERELIKVDGTRDGDTTITYDKMGWVTWMLSLHMGRENTLAGLRSFFDHYTADRDHPVLQDFVAHLRPFAPDPEAYDDFVRQWFLEIVLPEYVIEDARFEEDGGRGEVRFTLRNAGTGRMPVDIAAQLGERFPPEEATDPKPYRESRETVTLDAGESVEIRIACDFEPDRILVDPDAFVLQKGRKRAIHRF
ncbi:MAG: M1 family aminopeptidase [Planctomycetota bacterium]|nr:M1 family aminopeptidase [Planctomycetota bacterium]